MVDLGRSYQTQIDQHIQGVLSEAIKIVFPVDVSPTALIKTHNWRDRKYVGESDGKVVVWRGFSANLVSVDFRYRAIFIDMVENALSVDERINLFGEEFAQAIEELPYFVVMFVLDFPLETSEFIKQEGFIPRKMKKVLHACAVASPDDFLSMPSLYWAAKVARLVLLQRVLSVHRKPLDANEVPLQNLLFKSGYLHSYIVNNGLELNKLSRPRKAGEFGHDLQAIVSNPLIHPSLPFLFGIEIYTGPIGYHSNTIPQYVNYFGLNGIMVIAKDDPWPSLNNVANEFQRPIYAAKKLSDVGYTNAVAIHHLSLGKIVSDLGLLRDELEKVIPAVPYQKHANW